MGLILSQATLEERITSVDSKLERTTARVESLEKGWAKTASRTLSHSRPRSLWAPPFGLRPQKRRLERSEACKYTAPLAPTHARRAACHSRVGGTPRRLRSSAAPVHGFAQTKASLHRVMGPLKA